MDQDPIKQLQSFLNERGAVLDKIAGIHSTLGALRGDPPSSSAWQSASNLSVDATRTVIDAHYQRLLQAVQEMQGQIEQRVRPAVQLLVQHQVDQLRGQSDEKMAALRDCLGQIDRSILQCLVGLDEYQKRYTDLETLNKSLAGLDAPPEPLPDRISMQQLSETISARLASLGRS
ncbi:MAG TPA: hypothetical protein VF208_12450 [Candidatus Binatia bacterium]